MRVGPTLRPRVGASLTFTGRVRPKAKGLVVERQMLVDGVWTVKAKTRTTKGGRFTFIIKKAVPAGAQYAYRVVVYRDGVAIGTSTEKTIHIRPKKKKH